MRYAVIDIETTGMTPRTDRITEIAVVITDGERILEEYSTLINPERKIPYRITSITGISDEMVSEAPHFYEVAKKIVELTEGCIFVAHNASFDYSFIRHEYGVYNYDFQRDTLCTVRMSRKAFPGLKKYNLGSVCQHLGIPILQRHRALGDAKATAVLLHRILQQESEIDRKALRGMNSNLDPTLLSKLPHKTGVYYLRDEEGKIIYVGKSNDIRSRIVSHLNSSATRRALEIRNRIASVDFELTGSELIALLLESDEIKKHKPVYNRSQRRTSYPYGLFTYFDQAGYMRFTVSRINDGRNPLNTFTNAQAARNYLEFIVEEYELCQRLAGVISGQGACFHHSIHRCKGACIGEEPAEQYNVRANLALSGLRFDSESFIIIDAGRSLEERSVILVENGCYKGFGFVDINEAFSKPSELRERVGNYADNRDIRQILRSYLKRKKVEKIIPIKTEEDDA